MNPTGLTPLTVPVLTISRGDRWQVYQRLQELHIPCTCSRDGGLSVEIAHPIDILQLRSVIQQLTASRANLVGWLEQCWQAPEPDVSY